MTKEVEAKLPNKRWQINYDLAQGHDISCLRLLEVDSNNILLEVDLNKIPRGKTVLEFIEWIESTGIAFIDSFKEK